MSLVVLIGASGSGKSSFALRHFKRTEVLSSDFCRGLVADDEGDQSATNDAFAVLRFVAGKRLAAGRVTVIDATNVRSEDRKTFVTLAREHNVLPVAIVLDLPEKVCQARNAVRPERDFGGHVVRNQVRALHHELRGLSREGFRHVFILRTEEEVEQTVVERTRLYNDRCDEAGPFDIVGDVHGCAAELDELLERLGYARDDGGAWRHPGGRRAVFLGDLVDRGPRVVDVLRTAMVMSSAGSALCVPGNHDMKLVRKLRGRDVQVTHGLAETLAQLDRESPEFREKVVEFLDGLVSHYVFDGGKLVVAHAGMAEAMQGRASGRVRDFALYGETTGETDEFGLPVRYPWAQEYRGRAKVVFGHTPVPEPEWLNGTINIDTGCVFGGRLTALRYPELELVSVDARATYCEPARPFLPPEAQAPAMAAQQEQDDLLDIEDVLGKRFAKTRLGGNVTVRAENATAALEAMTRWAANPKWIVYLPPTMSPAETSQAPGLLEHPAQAFGYFRDHGVPRVVCEEKHMGSRAVLIVCRDAGVARKRFGVESDAGGTCLTRMGRAFFDDAAIEAGVIARVRSALTAAGFWDELATDWVVLDCELMPWSAKAQALLVEQYAPVAASGTLSLGAALRVVEEGVARGLDVASLRDRLAVRKGMVADYATAYGRYCWPVVSLDDLKLAPFHVLATEGKVHIDRDHVWHMTTIAGICERDPGLLRATPFLTVDVTDSESQAAGIRWWEELTGRGGEGMVVKPLDFVVRGRRGLVQPAVKCRGREYLRIIYGPEYTAPEHLERLRQRGLGRKRSLALREFALGIEALERFVRREPLRRVHECVFAVLAMESEPVDPRL
ncbi:MAG: polynucleotide kinase-phosphatase [Deltaproteobacteria bacterium]|nr:polynucleotide kinase-phosphatase [Deltaproteobacteria bacterium]